MNGLQGAGLLPRAWTKIQNNHVWTWVKMHFTRHPESNHGQPMLSNSEHDGTDEALALPDSDFELSMEEAADPEPEIHLWQAGRTTVVIAVSEGMDTASANVAWSLAAELGQLHNVLVTVRHGDGRVPLSVPDNACVVVERLPDHFTWQTSDVLALGSQWVQDYAPKYAIACGSESECFVTLLESSGIPTLAFINEVSTTSDVLRHRLRVLVATASQLVFASQSVASAAIDLIQEVRARDVKICFPPMTPVHVAYDRPPTETLEADGAVKGDEFLVVGFGPLQLELGVDLFIETASFLRRHRSLPIKFLWLQEGFAEPLLSAIVQQQLFEYGLSDCVEVREHRSSVLDEIAEADLLFLPARLEAVPERHLQAVALGLPILCFERASGIADLLLTSEITSQLVLPASDTASAGKLVGALASNPILYKELSTATQDLVRRRLSPSAIAASLDALGIDAANRLSGNSSDAARLSDRSCFNARFYAGFLRAEMPGDAAISDYLRKSRLVAPRNRPEASLLLRRPLEGFHPLIYASENPEFQESSGEDPLAHYLRSGRPAGRWQHHVIRPDSKPSASPLRVAVHGHFYYPEMLPDFLERLRVNKTEVTLLLSTTDAEKADRLKSIAYQAEYAAATVALVPNRGRDIGPFLWALDQLNLEDFDVVGHFHGKRTPQASPWIGETWRAYVWGNLIGYDRPIMDTIFNEFEHNPKLGMVFQEDPHLAGWDLNRNEADVLAARLGLPRPLPNHIEFPLGNMYWARPAALAPMIDLGLTADDLPPEPVPIDGTLLHALERLMVLICEKAGYDYSTVYQESCLR